MSEFFSRKIQRDGGVGFFTRIWIWVNSDNNK